MWDQLGDLIIHKNKLSTLSLPPWYFKTMYTKSQNSIYVLMLLNVDIFEVFYCQHLSLLITSWMNFLYFFIFFCLFGKCLHLLTLLMFSELIQVGSKKSQELLFRTANYAPCKSCTLRNLTALSWVEFLLNKYFIIFYLINAWKQNAYKTIQKSWHR